MAMMLPDTDIDIAMMFNLEPTCEYSIHVQLGHTGSAEWAINAVCPQCGNTKRNRLFCDPCKNIVQTAGEVQCEECDYVGMVGEFWKSIRRL